MLGPFSTCRFDFTLRFEQAILTIVPAVLFLLIAPFRLRFLVNQNVKVTKNKIGAVKLILSVLYAVSYLILLVVWTLQSSSAKTSWSVPTAAVTFLVAIGMIPLAHLEHNRSNRPSTLICAFLLFSTLFDTAQARTLMLLDYEVLLLVHCTCMGLKIVLLTLESLHKAPYLQPEFRDLSLEATASIINQSFMWWLNVIFRQGSKVSSFVDLYKLDHELQTEVLGKQMQKAWDSRSESNSGYAFTIVLAKCLYGPFSRVLFPRFCLIGFTFAQPFLITRVLSLLQEEEDGLSRQRGYNLIAATALIYLGIAISSMHSNHNLNRYITMFRGATVSLIYDRALKLQSGLSDKSAPVSLMSTDISRISFCFEELNECWAGLIEIAIGLPLLTLQLGWVSIMPLVVILLSSVGSSMVGKNIGGYQKAWSEASQKRISVTSAMLGDMKSLKMMGLSNVMTDLVQQERVFETKKREGLNWMIVWLNAVGNIPAVMSPAATFAVYAFQAYLTGRKSLDIVQAFTSLALIQLVSNPATRLLHAIPNVASSIGSFERIQDFLASDLHVDHRILLDANNERSQANGAGNVFKTTAVQLDGVSLKPSAASDAILQNIHLSVNNSSLTMITGPVGSGKTTLLKAILGEVACFEGSISVQTRRMAYCSQSPWLPNGTVHDVICGFAESHLVDEEWYQAVVEACALKQDIFGLSQGSHTVIGSRGGKLSGGQKQRLALARAVYSRAKILVLDDIFSALDKKTGDVIAESLFGKAGLFKRLGSTVILVTHATQYLYLADSVAVLSQRGRSLKQGSFITAKEEGWIDDIGHSRLEIEPQTVTEDDEKINEEKPASADYEAQSEAQDLGRQTGDISIYKYYFRHVGVWPMLAFIFSVFLNVGSASFSQIWLKWWADIGGRQIILYITIYFILALLYSIGNAGYVWAISVVIGPSTGRKLHKILLDIVMRAPQSFFVKTDSGSILNRFSQDMSVIENQLSVGVLITGSNLVSSLVEAAFVALGSAYMGITIPFLMVVIYRLQDVYLRTSRQLRYLDLESRSPMYSHFTETIEGLSTIRAFGWENEMKEINYERTDDSQKPYYLLFCIQRWLALVLDLIVAAMAVVVIALATSLRGSTSPGLLGVSLNNILAFNSSLSAFITGWTLLETSLGAISRLKDFEETTEVESKPGETVIPPKDWPSQGRIAFFKASASYNKTTVAFQDINLTIQPGQKVVICGRTGSGKTSLISSIIRTLDLTHGQIKIDNLDLSTLPCNIIRRRLITIPQDPFLIPTHSIRQNIDPFNIHSPQEIQTVLTKVGLWRLVEERGGLEAEMLNDTLSKGELQLFALARALLLGSSGGAGVNGGRKVVLMDEPSSSVDSDTLKRMRVVVEEGFRECTVVTVAHRKDTILEADVVVVMDMGRIVEVGKPGDLMEIESGALRNLLGSAREV